MLNLGIPQDPTVPIPSSAVGRATLKIQNNRLQKNGEPALGTRRVLDKKAKKLERQAVRRKNSWKKLGLAILILVAFISVVATAEWYNASHQPPPRYIGPKPTSYQEGVLVNQSTTFPFDNEWNFLLRAGRNVTIILEYRTGAGANAAFSMNDPSNGGLTTPYLFSAQLKPANPTTTWSGVLQTDGSYRIELGNIGNENNAVTLQVLVEAT